MEQEAISREIYKKVFNIINDFQGTVSDLVENYTGFKARDLFDPEELGNLICDVADGTKTKDEIKNYVKGKILVGMTKNGITGKNPIF